MTCKRNFKLNWQQLKLKSKRLCWMIRIVIRMGLPNFSSAKKEPLDKCSDFWTLKVQPRKKQPSRPRKLEFSFVLGVH